MSWDSTAYITPEQRWISNEDPGTSIYIEGSRSTRWLVRDDRGDVVEMTGAQLRADFHLAST
jgi:hypothetical protein